MLALRSYEKKYIDGFAAMTADELKFINGGASNKRERGTHTTGDMGDSYGGKGKKK